MLFMVVALLKEKLLLEKMLRVLTIMLLKDVQDLLVI